MSESVIREIFSRHPNAGREHLIPILQEVQEHYGFLSRESIIKVGEHLKLPVSKIYGVASFYNQFKFQAPGKYHVQVCRGTACHVKGSARILEAVQNALQIGPGQTSRDKMFSLEIVACMGACGLSPVICINGEFYAKVTPSKVADIIDRYKKKGL